MLVFYIRHGDPIYDPDGLTPLGEEQAAAVARRLALYGIDEVYSSPSNRALQTAKPLCDTLGLEPKILDFLNENVIGVLQPPLEHKEGSLWLWAHPKYSEILCSREVRELGDKWYTHPSLASFGFEKTILPINEQIDAFFASFGYEHDREKGLYRVTDRKEEKRIAIFAHECMSKIFMSHVLDVPFAQYAAHFEMHTSAFNVIRFDDGMLSAEQDGTPPYPYARARLLSMSNDSHLYRDGVTLNHRFTRLREWY